MNEVYSVWVGACEVNNYYLSLQDAKELAQEYKNDNYDSVVIRREKND
jgi:elongation factor P--beta-lysine ligase